jgi:hypothetical protein
VVKLLQLANAVFCDRHGVSEQPATMSIFAEFAPLCVIFLTSSAVLSFSPCRGNVSRFCVIWQPIF